MTDIETDYEELAAQINAKIKEAAAAMKEANKLAKAAGINSLTYDEYGDSSDDVSEEALEEFRDNINIYPLFNELDQAGWRTSSIGC